jgi:gas vesicle protein
MEDRSNGVGYFFLGLGVGAAVGLLLAPRSGVDSRKFLLTKTGEGADYLKRQGQDLVDNATGTIERGKQKVRVQVNTLSDAVNAGRQAYREALETPPSANS